MKIWQKILVGIGILFLFLVFARVIGQGTGLLGFYSIPATGNSPTLEKGDKFFVSNLSEAKILDFVAYKYSLKNLHFINADTSEQIWIHRLIAKEGDEVVIKNSRAIVNGVEIDKGLNLKKAYITDFHGQSSLADLFKLDEENIFQKTKYEYLVYLSDSQFEQVKSRLPLKPYYIDYTVSLAQEFKKLSWTLDNLGPFTVPEGTIFVLGDNRQGVMDSRVIGFIPIADVVGVKVF